MFILHDFVLKTILGMAGKEPEYKVRQYALGWYDKAELTAEDMQTIETALNPPEEIEEAIDPSLK